MWKLADKNIFKGLCGFFSILTLCGFDYSKHSIPLEDIYDGGPGKDGIPAIIHPKFISAKDADRESLKNEDRILGVVHQGKARAYPIKILNWHEIVNDTVEKVMI